MSKMKASKGVGDIKTPPLMATERGLRFGVEQADKIEADVSKPAVQCSALSELVALQPLKAGKSEAFNCRQTLWFTFFFDGTGNNRDADTGFLKHSNVAKLYNVMAEDETRGIYSSYIPGVATYFSAIGDNGGSAEGNVGGAMGEARINYALMEMDRRLRRHLELARAPSNAISEINIAVFGFSRGAALARAFANKLIETRCKSAKGRFTLANGGWLVRLRFLGLFDTVASVGLPMSSKTTSTLSAIRGDTAQMIEKRLKYFRETQPQILAFAERGLPGADPAAIGAAHGHDGYGGKLAISESVEEVRHFIAAHEMRNSFPVDSISILNRGRIVKPAHFHETVYPGVHSDVGGSYAPEEGGKSVSAPEKYGVIPLNHMYQHATRAGVPLLNPGAWTKDNKNDFSVNSELLANYDYYLKLINAPGTLGQVMNNHMQLYYAWRFRSIRLKLSGDKSEAREIATASSKFKATGVPIDNKLAALQAHVDAVDVRVTDLQNQIREYEMNGENEFGNAELRRLKDDRDEAKAKLEIARQNFLKEKARKDALPDMSKFQTLLDLYDKQLMKDAQAILEVLTKKPGWMEMQTPFTRADLRPHYRVLIEAYEAEFIHHRGLTDKAVIHFFDEYIHDSLAGFGADATLPSDPRVVYLGGDEKLAYASLESDGSEVQHA